MPRSTRPQAYGPEYEQLLLTAHAAATRTGSWLCPMAQGPSHAHALKRKVHAYFAALRKAGDRPELIAQADRLSLRVTGPALEFFLREDSWDSVAIREVLGLPKGFAELGGAPVLAPPTAHSDMLEKLKALRQHNHHHKE